MEIEYYIGRCLTDHLLNTTNYQKISEGDATAITVANFEWICENFIDAQPSPDTFTKLEQDYFIAVLCGDRDRLGCVPIKNKLQLPYFYALPKNPQGTVPNTPSGQWSFVYSQPSKQVDICPITTSSPPMPSLSERLLAIPQ